MTGYDPTKYVLIDPDDEAQVQRIYLRSLGSASSLRAALRAEREPAEPTKVGAIIRDGNDVERVRRLSIAGEPFWDTLVGSAPIPWRVIPRPITVLFEGVDPVDKKPKVPSDPCYETSWVLSCSKGCGIEPEPHHHHYLATGKQIVLGKQCKGAQ